MILTNKKILVTRDQEQAQSFVKMIKAHGGTALCFPTIAIQAPETWQNVDEKLHKLSSYDWIIFTSANSVRFLLKRLDDKSIQLPHIRIAAIGNKTNKILQEFRYRAHVLPDNFTAASLLKTLKQQDLSSTRILLPVSDIARQELYDGLIKLGANVDRVVVYRNRLNEPDNKNEVINLLQNGKIDMLTFFSPSALVNFAKIVGTEMLETIQRQNIAIAVIGPTTAQAAQELGFTPQIEPVNSTSENMIEAILEYYKIVKE